MQHDVPAAPVAEKAIFRVHIEAPIERVWDTLVRTDEVLPFFFGSVCRTPTGRLQIGTPMAMRSPDDKYTAVVGKVLAFEPPYRYSHTLIFTQFSDQPATVTYELRDVGGSTEFTLTQTNVPAGSKTEKSMNQGGTLIVNTLKGMAETGKAPFSTRMILALIGLLRPLTPRACRSEHWSFERIEKL